MCTITIDTSTLIASTDSSGAVIRIEVQGHSSECDEVSVTVHDTTHGVVIGPATFQPDGAGHWTASFVDGQGVDLKDVQCDDKMSINAKCTDSTDGKECQATEGKDLPCKPGTGGGCPEVTVTVEPGACNAANTQRTMTFHVTVGGGAQIQYMWNFGDGTPLTAPATGSGTFSQSHSYAAGATYNANLILFLAGCTASPDPITVVVAACGDTTCPDNPRLVADLHLSGGRRQHVDIEAQCVPPGDYTIGVANAYPTGTVLFWSVDDQTAVQGGSIDVTIDAGQTVRVEVIATKDGCPPVSQSIELSGCLTDCPTDNELILERRRPGHRAERISTTDGCIAAGDYVVRLVEPSGDVQIDWFEDGVAVPNQHGRTLRIRVEEGQVLTVSAEVRIAGCDDLNPSITVEACKCPDDLSLAVFDQDGDPVDPAQCVAPGTFTVRAAASGLGDQASGRTWSIDGREVAGNGTEIAVRVPAPVVVGCGGAAPATTASITVSTPGCDPRTASVTLRPCAEFVFNVCCQLIGSFILLLFGLTMIAAALALCPQVLVIPPLVAFFVAFGLLIFVALLVLLIIALIVWFLLCPPDWCRDILPKLWQGALMAGIIFIYFGSCPLCNVTPIGSLFVWGVLLLLVGAGLLLFWILSCRPTQCETVWRLVELGVVNTIIGAISTVIALLPLAFGLSLCVSLLAVIFLWLVTGFLDFLTLMLPLFCGFNPIAPAAFGPFRRPPPPAPLRDPFRRRLVQAAPHDSSRLDSARLDSRGEGGRAAAAAAAPATVAPSGNKRGRNCGCGNR